MLPCEVWDRLGALRQIQELAVLAAFFCLLFFAAAKKSRCRPAQGRRLNGKHHIADASAQASTQRQSLRRKPRHADTSGKKHKRPRRAGASQTPVKKQKPRDTQSQRLRQKKPLPETNP